MHWLDPLVPLSFGAAGYHVHARRFAPLPDATGRVVAVTGANAGLGLATTHALVAAGAEVIAVCRSPERAEAALGGLERVHVHIADLADLSSVRALAAALPRLDALVHNAGALLDTLQRTADGLETTTACHLVGPHVLTRAIAERVDRVVFVSSGGMYLSRLSLRQLQSPREPFDGVTQYAIAKRAQVLLPGLYAEHVSNAPRVEVMHPGWADTPGVVKSLPRFRRLTRRILRTPAQGADTAVWLSLAELPPHAEGIWLDRRLQPLAPIPGTATPPTSRAALWAWLESHVVD